MKTFVFKKTMAILLSGAIILTGCKKDADKVFSGSGRIKGIVYYNNLATNRNDTATNAQMTISLPRNIGTEYLQTLTNGTFDITSLGSNSYNVHITYSHTFSGSAKSIRYAKDTVFDLQKDEFKFPFNFVLLPDSVESPTLQIIVTDQNNTVVPNAQVCLYADLLTLTSNRGTCVGSVKSGTTNPDGIIVFDGLQVRNYYVAVTTTSGTGNQSNQPTEATAIAITSSSKPTSAPVKIQRTGYILQVGVVDFNKQKITGANVCLYDDAGLLIKYRQQCIASLQSGPTNSQGVITFSGLSAIPYYISAYQVTGKDTLSNRTTDLLPVTPVANSLNYTEITILRQTAPNDLYFKITVVDQFGAIITNANVCLYSDPALLVKYRTKCTGSLFSGTTDANGTITFSGLQAIPYYISAYKIFGNDVLSNSATDSNTPFNPANTNQINPLVTISN